MVWKKYHPTQKISRQQRCNISFHVVSQWYLLHIPYWSSYWVTTALASSALESSLVWTACRVGSFHDQTVILTGTGLKVTLNKFFLRKPLSFLVSFLVSFIFLMSSILFRVVASLNSLKSHQGAGREMHRIIHFALSMQILTQQQMTKEQM